MRRNTILLVSMLVLTFGASLRAANADVTVGVSLFYDDLAPHGDWFEMENYGWVWTPRHVDADWRPYTRGRWVFTNENGWLWASDEEWGWATCHYGRWFFDDRYGWVWVPGRDWAPAWVAWRFGGGYVGWAPLPPQFRWNAGVGFRVGDVDFDAWLTPRQYVFVQERHFVDPRVYREVVSPARNWTIVRETQNVTNYGVRQNRLVNRSLSVEQVEGHLGHAVPRVRVVDEHVTPPRRTEVKGDTVRVFRPAVRSDSSARPRSARAAGDVPRVKPHPVDPPVEGADVRRPERPATASLPPGPGREAAPSRSITPGPRDAMRTGEPKLQHDRQVEEQRARARQVEEQRAKARSEELKKQQDRQQEALHERQARQAQQLQQKQGQELQREARARQGQRQAELERQQAEQRLKLQQKHERDHQALGDTQVRQQQALQEKQRKQQAQADEKKRKQQAQADEKRRRQQQSQESKTSQEGKNKKAAARPQPNSPPS